MSIAHAQHNESLCDEIIKLGGYNDWVITTAFYSALHYVTSKIFPLTEGTVVYADFDDYYNKKYPNTPNQTQKSQHRVRINLVSSKLFSIQAKYRQLFELSHTARYVNYQVSQITADKARNDLIDISNYCLPKTAKSSIPHVKVAEDSAKSDTIS